MHHSVYIALLDFNVSHSDRHLLSLSRSTGRYIGMNTGKAVVDVGVVGLVIGVVSGGGTTVLTSSPTKRHQIDESRDKVCGFYLY